MDSKDTGSSNGTEPNEQFKFAVDPRLSTVHDNDRSGVATIVTLFTALVVAVILLYMSRWLVASHADVAQMHLLGLPSWAIQLAAIGGSLLVIVCAVMVYVSIANIYYFIQYATGTGPTVENVNVTIIVLKLVAITAILCACTALYLFAFYLV